MLMSTSGTTGAAKGVPVPLRALNAISAYMRYAIDLRADDTFWNIADPGWAYGLYYAITGPLMLGCATLLYEGGFTAESTYRILRRMGVTNLAGSPTAYRLLIAAGPELAEPVKGALRVVSSAGEPLNPEVMRWFEAHLAAPIHDHYGQTENGMMVNNHHGLAHPVRPGSSGLPMPGYRMAVLDEAGNELGPNRRAFSPSISRARRSCGSGAIIIRTPRPSRAATIAPATRWNWSRTARSASSGARTTSSPRRAIASGRSTWKAR